MSDLDRIPQWIHRSPSCVLDGVGVVWSTEVTPLAIARLAIDCYDRVNELTAENERLLCELDPPVCRLQFPDGAVPANVREAAEGWKKWADERGTRCERKTARIEELAALCEKYMAERNSAEIKLAAVRAKLQEIVCVVPPDDGVVLLSNEGPTHYDAEQKCQVYNHEHFSPLGDALIELWKLTEPTP